jgi:hypothetical protein
MKKAVWSGIAAVVGVLVMSSSVYAQSTHNINVQVTVNARAKLAISTGAITFVDADPDLTPTFTSAPISIDVKARTSAGGAVELTVQAGGDFTNGTVDIPLNTLQWTSTGTGYVNGSSDSNTPQTVGSWIGSGHQSGAHTYTLPNSWSYATGTYAVALNYTLATP